MGARTVHADLAVVHLCLRVVRPLVVVQRGTRHVRHELRRVVLEIQDGYTRSVDVHREKAQHLVAKQLRVHGEVHARLALDNPYDLVVHKIVLIVRRERRVPAQPSE